MNKLIDKNKLISENNIINKIFSIRGLKVMVDRDLAILYNVETRALNQAVKRNIKRFPADFMFRMTDEEFLNWKSQIVISKSEKMGLRKAPLVFTEQGVAMLSGILNSETAIKVNIQIIRVFVKLRRINESTCNIKLLLSEIEKKGNERDKKIQFILDYLNQLEKERFKNKDQKERPKIGYRQSKQDNRSTE